MRPRQYQNNCSPLPLDKTDPCYIQDVPTVIRHKRPHGSCNELGIQTLHLRNEGLSRSWYQSNERFTGKYTVVVILTDPSSSTSTIRAYERTTHWNLLNLKDRLGVVRVNISCTSVTQQYVWFPLLSLFSRPSIHRSRRVGDRRYSSSSPNHPPRKVGPVVSGSNCRPRSHVVVPETVPLLTSNQGPNSPGVVVEGVPRVSESRFFLSWCRLNGPCHSVTINNVRFLPSTNN